MNENCELEEGEACYNDDDDRDLDPDITLSYIDEKIQNVLGHFQKDFEGGVSAENLGAKFGGYGSFLPTYERSPTSCSHQKTPQWSSNAPRSPNKLPLEGSSQSSKVPSSAPPLVKYNAFGLNNSGVASGDASAKQGFGSSSVLIAQKSILEDGKQNLSCDKRTLKFRLKVGSDNLAQKSAALCSGLGLDNSPSSSLGKSPEESGRLLPTSPEISDVSPTSILQVMTAFPVPGDFLISPLHENLLCIVREEILSRDSKSGLSFKDNEEDSAVLVDGSVSALGSRKVSKQVAKLPSKSEKAVELKQENGINFDNDTTFSAKENLDRHTSESKGMLSSNLKSMPCLSTLPIIDSMKVNVRASEFSKETNGDGVRGKCFISNSVEGKIVRQTIDIRGKTIISREKEKPLSEDKKKLLGIESRKKAVALSNKESSRVGVRAAPKDPISVDYGLSTSGKKLRKPKSQCDIHERDNCGDSLETKLEQTNKWICSSESVSGDWPKDTGLGDLEINQNSLFVQSKERTGVKRVNNQPVAGTSVKEVIRMGSHIVGNAVGSEITPTLDPVVIEEDWVCCDRCQKWRLLPFGTKPDQLPEKWLCSMLNWLPGMNRCDISEDETTKALNALYQLPVAGGQNDVQNLANGTASGVTSANVQHVDQNHPSVNSNPVSSQENSKLGLKKMMKAGSRRGLMQTSNSTKKHLQELGESRRLTDMSQPTAATNFIYKSSLDQLSKSHSLVVKENIVTQKDNHMNGVDVKKLKMKSKREADHHGYGTSKRIKKEDMRFDHKQQKSDIDLGRVNVNSTSLPSKASGKRIEKSNEYSSSADVKCDTVEKLPSYVTPLGDLAQVSSDGGFYMRACNERDTSLKKRKLKEWQNDQNVHGSKFNAEENGEGGLKKEKKSGVSKNVVKEHCRKSFNDTPKENGSVAHILFTGSKDQPVDGRVEVKNDHQSKKRRKEVTSQRASDGVESLREEFGSGKISVSATSSSSKVSGSLKKRATSDDVKGSPVESVSSSPLRALFPEKLTLAGMDIVEKDGAMFDSRPVISELNSRWDVGGGVEINHSGMAKKEKATNDRRPKSASRQCSNDQLATVNCHDEDRVDNSHHGKMLLQQKSGKSSTLRLKDNDRDSTSDLGTEKMKVSGPVSEQGNKYSKKNTMYESKAKFRASFDKNPNNKLLVHDKPSPKSSKGKKDYVEECSEGNKTKTHLKLDEHCDSDAKLDRSCGMNSNAVSHQNLFQEFEGDTELDTVQKELRNLTQNLHMHLEGDGKQQSQDHLSLPGSHLGGRIDGLSVHSSGNSGASKALIAPGNADTVNGARHLPDLRAARDLYAQNLERTNSSQTATCALNDARQLKDYANRLKGSGFGFESNEANFQAALKFLLGASLLEMCNSEGGRQGEMNQMQIYSTTAKLCEGCALEYERRHEMAAAALAYKCMEVAYWRVVYCKNSSSSRDRNDLQASLQMIPQGDSPSSSASDVDNLNNQASVEKATLSKGAVPQVAGNPVIVARNHSKFLRLLDFMQDVNLAVEASKKSQNAFLAANVVLEEIQHKDCITSVKRVIDFSFQDVEELIRLVQLAMEAINRSGFGGPRD